ncbi:MAG: hypothetical protein ACK55I_13330, partial [bacterium]
MVRQRLVKLNQPKLPQQSIQQTRQALRRSTRSLNSLPHFLAAQLSIAHLFCNLNHSLFGCGRPVDGLANRSHPRS